MEQVCTKRERRGDLSDTCFPLLAFLTAWRRLALAEPSLIPSIETGLAIAIAKIGYHSLLAHIFDKINSTTLGSLANNSCCTTSMSRELFLLEKGDYSFYQL